MQYSTEVKAEVFYLEMEGDFPLRTGDIPIMGYWRILGAVEGRADMEKTGDEKHCF